MCRLFGLSGGSRPMSARFWLLDAPDSLAAQSHRDPDGTGIGTFDAAGRAVVEKAAIAAFGDAAFAREARTVRSRTFVAHLRIASQGPVSFANTHPFLQDGRLFAHNGVVGGLAALDAELGDDGALVQGDTDSERLFALVTREIRRADGDVAAGLAAALVWVAATLPVFALNLVLTTSTELYAFRYPENHELYVLERPAGGGDGKWPLHYRSSMGSSVSSEDGAHSPLVVVASEPLDSDPGWRLLRSGELVSVDAGLVLTSAIVLPGAPTHPLTLAELDAAEARASAGQRPGPASAAVPIH